MLILFSIVLVGDLIFLFVLLVSLFGWYFFLVEKKKEGKMVFRLVEVELGNDVGDGL